MKGLQCSLIPEYIVYKSSKNAKTSNRVFYFHKKANTTLQNCYWDVIPFWSWTGGQKASSRHSRLLPGKNVHWTPNNIGLIKIQVLLKR